MNSFDLPPRRYTYDEIAQWPDEARRELDDGAPIMIHAPEFCPVVAHSHCVGALFMAFVTCKNSKGDTILLVDWQIDEWNSVAPDLCFFDAAPIMRADGPCLISAPNLTIEVWDERTNFNDTQRKPLIYARQNVPLFWLVDPQQQTVRVHQNPTANGYLSIEEVTKNDVLTCSFLPDFHLPLTQIFD